MEMGKLLKVTRDELVEVKFLVPKEWYEFIQEFLEWSGYETEEERQEELQLELSCRFGMWIYQIVQDEFLKYYPKKKEYFIKKYDLKLLTDLVNVYVTEWKDYPAKPNEQIKDGGSNEQVSTT